MPIGIKRLGTRNAERRVRTDVDRRRRTDRKPRERLEDLRRTS